MKILNRIFSLLLALAFFMATTGFSVYEHYCGDNLVETSLYSSNKTCNPEHSEDDCSSEQKKNCCSDEFQFVQLDIELKNPDWNRQSLNFASLPFIHFPNFLEKSAWSEDQIYFPSNYLLPKAKAEPIYILQQKLVFYG